MCCTIANLRLLCNAILYHHTYSLGGYSLAASCKSEALGGGCLYRYTVDCQPQVGCNVLPHLQYVRRHFWRLRHYGNVDIARSKTHITQNIHYGTQKHTRICALPLRISIREMLSYVAGGYSPKQCVAQGMKRDIGVAVAEKSLFVCNIYTADYAATAFHQTVDIKTMSYTYIGYHRRFPKRSLRPSISKVSENRSVWSRGEVCAVARMYDASRRNTLSEKPAPKPKYLRPPLNSFS